MQVQKTNFRYILARWNDAWWKYFGFKIDIYFILSSELTENISAIKVVSIYSEMIWYHFTVDWYHHSMRELPFSTILGIVVFRKDFACILLVWHYTTDVSHHIKQLSSHFDVTLEHATEVQRQIQAAFLNCKILLIPSFKWHFKPFSRCNQYYTQ